MLLSEGNARRWRRGSWLEGKWKGEESVARFATELVRSKWRLREREMSWTFYILRNLGDGGREGGVSYSSTSSFYN